MERSRTAGAHLPKATPPGQRQPSHSVLESAGSLPAVYRCVSSISQTQESLRTLAVLTASRAEDSVCALQIKAPHCVYFYPVPRVILTAEVWEGSHSRLGSIALRHFPLLSLPQINCGMLLGALHKAGPDRPGPGRGEGGLRVRLPLAG